VTNSRKRSIECTGPPETGHLPGGILAGLADDLAWRVEQSALDEQLLIRRAVAVMAAGMLVVALWSIPALFAGAIRSVDACAGQPPAPERRYPICTSNS
jgi:hypothetical protein